MSYLNPALNYLALICLLSIIYLNSFQVEIVKLKLDKDRKRILDRKAKAKLAEKAKGKHTEEEVAMVTE